MKKNLFLLANIIISLAILAGCGKYSEGISAADTQKSLTEKTVPSQTTPSQTTPSQSADTTGWEPTPYETINNFDGVTMTIKEGTASSTGLTVGFKNNSASQCIYGSYFGLEKKINKSWYKVPVTIEGNYGFDSIGYDLPSGGDGEWAVKWDWLYGSLGTGDYRIVKDIGDYRAPGDFDTYYLAAEFTI